MFVYFIPHKSKIAINEVGKIKSRLEKTHTEREQILTRMPEITFFVGSSFKGKLEVQGLAVPLQSHPR